MADSVITQIRALQRMSVAELRVRWRELYREESRSRNRDFLIKRLCWRVQECAHGGLSDRAKQRIRELAPTAEFFRAQVPRGFDPEAAPAPVPPPAAKSIRDLRLPASGAVITRTWRRREIRVLVLDDGFEWDGRRFGSLSEVARAVTGQHWSGPLFFGLRQRSGRR